jgi:hypothetical protein
LQWYEEQLLACLKGLLAPCAAWVVLPNPVFYSRRDFFVVSPYSMEEKWLPGRFHGATECHDVLTIHGMF